MTLNKEYGHTSRYGRIQPLAKTKGDKQEDCWIPAVFFFFFLISYAQRNMSKIGHRMEFRMACLSLCYVIQLVPSNRSASVG